MCKHRSNTVQTPLHRVQAGYGSDAADARGARARTCRVEIPTPEGSLAPQAGVRRAYRRNQATHVLVYDQSLDVLVLRRVGQDLAVVHQVLHASILFTEVSARPLEGGT